MTAAAMRVALVSPAGATRSALAGYLRDAGFDVKVCASFEAARGFDALVVVSAAGPAADRLPDDIRAWMRGRGSQLVVVVSTRPTALKKLAAEHDGRLHVLPAPAWGWDVVDTLRVAGQRRDPA